MLCWRRSLLVSIRCTSRLPCLSIFCSISFSSSGFPEGRQQFGQPVDGLLREYLQCVRQIMVRVNSLQFATSQYTVNHRRSLSSSMGSGKQLPFFSKLLYRTDTDNSPPDASFVSMAEPLGCGSPNPMRDGTAGAAARGGWPDAPGTQEMPLCAQHHKAEGAGELFSGPLGVLRSYTD